MKELAKALSILLVLCAGCVSSGYRNKQTSFPASRNVVIIANEAAYQPLLKPVFETRGFTLATNGTPNALHCQCKRVGFSITHSEVSLWDGATKLLSGNSSNYGWGNWMAHEAAKEQLITKSVEKFEKQLDKTLGK